MKIHLNIKDDLPPIIAIECVKQVIQQGRISNNGKMYCYATCFDTIYGEVLVFANLYRKSDCFTIEKQKK